MSLRVLSLAPSHTEVACALGAQDLLCGVTSYCDFPALPPGLPRVPGWSSIKAADVLALEPDLVLTSSLCQERLRLELEDAGLVLLHSDPRTLKQVEQGFMELGEALDREAEGRELAKRFARGLHAFKPGPGPRPRVYVEEWHQPPMAAGNWVPEMVLAAGGEPFNRELGRPSDKVSWEEILEFNPELVVYSICGLRTAFDPAEFYKTEGFALLEAGKNRRVCSVNDDLFNRPGPRLLEGIALLSQLIKGQVDEAQAGNCRFLV